MQLFRSTTTPVALDKVLRWRPLRVDHWQSTQPANEEAPDPSSSFPLWLHAACDWDMLLALTTAAK
jgi:hypothetical protein